ncbi:alkaline phosphatase D family protein [Thalassoglobus sp. JC818]|uniref:alkaline phosphatase D family protein n=1 Tax=Thalassoglobus sp. JC818 TaxID=3232136 RepID=UPI003457D2E5
MNHFSRRLVLKTIAGGAALIGLKSKASAQTPPQTSGEPIDSWGTTHNRVWLGSQFWANPMEDWRIVDGAAECQSLGNDRNIHLITHQLTDPQQPFAMSVDLAQVEVNDQDAGAGFRVGTRSDINEYRSNVFANNGIDAGLVNGELVLGKSKQPLKNPLDVKGFRLHLASTPMGKQCKLTLTAQSLSGDVIDSVTTTVPSDQLLGNISLVNNYQPQRRRNNQQANGGKSRYRFSNWIVDGEAFTVAEDRKFGPILWSMYSLSDSRSDEGFVMKISALTGPLGEEDNQDVELYIQQNGEWKDLGTAALDQDAWVATFRVPNWDEKTPTPYKLVYRERHTDGTETESEWTGTIQKNPTGRPLRFGALTCQNDYAFPYEPVVNNLLKLDPDLIYFSGDQIYESHGGYGIIRDPAGPAILNYLRKYYQFGWSFREAMRDRPTLCIPDDHDVFQGNIWGEGGAAMTGLDQGASSKGGYREPARMVNVVHTTCVAHHPDFADPTPVKQDISVYYGDMVYGDVSFAIVADRQWKSGPERVDTGSGRADHVQDPDFDTSKLDKPGLVLLGERQEEFLRNWSEDWRGHSMKVLLSQTVFAGVATHHGGFDGYLKADLDCGGWPQTARNRAIDIARKSKALHINGDQHLTTLAQYGVDQQRDSFWSFCSPAIAVGYPRWWRPDEIDMPHENRPEHGLANTGEFVDGLGNLVYVYAVGNPEVGTAPNRYDRAHQKGSGLGLVTIDTEKKTYLIESFRFLIDITDGNPSNQFPGWPVTIHQDENAGDNRLS